MYLNQTASWLQIKKVNSYGDIEYFIMPFTIAVRKQPHQEEVTDKNGKVHVSKHIFYTHNNVVVDELLDGELVVSTYDMNSLGGHKVLRRCITI